MNIRYLNWPIQCYLFARVPLSQTPTFYVFLGKERNDRGYGNSKDNKIIIIRLILLTNNKFNDDSNNNNELIQR